MPEDEDDDVDEKKEDVSFFIYTLLVIKYVKCDV